LLVRVYHLHFGVKPTCMGSQVTLAAIFGSGSQKIAVLANVSV